MTIIMNGKRFAQFTYPTEKDFEDDIVRSSRIIFGPDSIYIDVKKRIESKTLGMTIPDGFLFDFSDPTDPQFYIVEVELVQHGFYAHIFPQITKFFAFYKTGGMQKTLVDKLHSIIDGDITLKSDFKGKLGNGEIYKFLSDILGSSQNILLISDDSIRELREIMDTYSETWGRMVKFLEVRKFTNGADVLFSLTPDFETLPYSDSGTEPEGTGNGGVTEKYHLDNASEEVLKIYEKIKQTAAGIDHRLVFNPQKYYISIKASKNIVFLTIRKSKIRFIALMPEEEIRSIVKNHVVVALSPPVQKFYNSPCASIDLRDTKHFEEIEQVMKLIVSRSQWGT